MCRFTAYLGRKPILLASLLKDHEHSLIRQSLEARETKTGLNADGFGVGWFDRKIQEKPGLFKSTQPAWNDRNLSSLAELVQSDAFIAHIRASTVGDVSLDNCHPFHFHNLLGAHNGTIRGFSSIRRAIYNLLPEDIFQQIKGNTDSEHLFALIASFFLESTTPSLENLAESTRKGLHKIEELLSRYHPDGDVRTNLAISNGNFLLATRYQFPTDRDPIGLYYSFTKQNPRDHHIDFVSADEDYDGIVVASERLTEASETWEEIPANHFLLVCRNLQIRLHQV